MAWAKIAGVQSCGRVAVEDSLFTKCCFWKNIDFPGRSVSWWVTSDSERGKPWWWQIEHATWPHRQGGDRPWLEPWEACRCVFGRNPIYSVGFALQGTSNLHCCLFRSIEARELRRGSREALDASVDLWCASRHCTVRWDETLHSERLWPSRCIESLVEISLGNAHVEEFRAE